MHNSKYVFIKRGEKHSLNKTKLNKKIFDIKFSYISSRYYIKI